MTMKIPAVIPARAGTHKAARRSAIRCLRESASWQRHMDIALRKERDKMDPRTTALGTDRWLTDSRVYNLVWLGRWIERAETVSRVLKWAAEQQGCDVGTSPRLDEIAGMAASVRGVSISSGESALDALLTRDSSASLRGCLTAARYNATHVAPVEVIQNIGAAIQCLDDLDDSPSNAEEVASLMGAILAQLDELHESIEESWFHSDALSEEDVFRRFMQQ